jgi:trehalose synthase-fused probable maltokinase
VTQHAGWQTSGKDLATFLETKRWFGDKGRDIREVSLDDVIPVRWPGVKREFAVARARVHTDDGTSNYQLFLADDGGVSDALADDVFRRGLVDAFQRGASFESDGVRWIIETESATPLVVPPTAPVTLSTAEQTNSSVFVDAEAILKLYRKLESGIHPDVEVTRFLTIERRFVHVPVLLGTIRFEDGTDTTTAGMLQELVPAAVDGWTYALDCSRRYFTDGSAGGALPFEEESRDLGGVTRALHDTLASGAPGSAFETSPATPADVRAWVESATRMMERAIAGLMRAVDDNRIPREQRRDAQALIERRPDYLNWLTELAADIDADAGAKARIHGDYHLGQVLRSAAARFLVIDFEGEPARPMSERRARQSPLRDVAGMLRSFSYASATASRRNGGAAAGDRATRWERAVRDAFLRAYFAGNDRNVTLLPRSQRNAGRLLGLFEAEKAFYELLYELDHRPDWVWIPLRDIARLTT